MSTYILPAPPEVPIHGMSTLSQQQDQDEGDTTPRSIRFTNFMTPKPRSLSDAPKPVLSPSPSFREPIRRVSKDDSVLESPTTPRRPSYHVRGLSLTVPLSDSSAIPPGSSVPRVPLSPKLDASQIYGSPASMLPRRSRGMDYTRACTNLHHSTLAESSPDASPITGRGMQIPQRRSMGATTVLDSPSNMSSQLWSTVPERTNLSSSVSSVNMLDSDSDSENSSDDEMAIDRENEDPMLSTPAVSRLTGGLIANIMNSPGSEWMTAQQASPAQASLMSFQPSMMGFRRARMRKGKSQHSSSSVSMNSSKPSPGPLSPGIMKSVESTGYFGSGMTRQQVQSRRESLSLGTDHLHLSDSEENSNKQNGSQSLSDMDGANMEGPRGVVRRAVTRRGNLLPKTKGFARIRAALLEEAQPVDSEVRREAEVIRQVQENDPNTSKITSPPLPAPIPSSLEPLETSIEDNGLMQESSNENKTSVQSDSFSRQAERNSAGLGFWQGFDARYRTPPPSFLPRESSSAISDEMLDTPGSSLANTSDHPALKHFNRSRSRSTTPLANYGAPTAGDVARRVNNKRRRDDDFDPAFTKRRAVSPGMSVQSSPVLPQSPVTNSDRPWGKPPAKTNGHGDRSNSGGSVSGMKKVGLQGMTETNDGIMSMSID